MQDFIGSVCRSLVFKPSDAGGVFGGFVEKIGSIIRKPGIGLFSKPPVPALPPIAKSDAINVKKDDAFGRVYMGLNIDSGALPAIKQPCTHLSWTKNKPQRIEPSMAVEAGHLNLVPPQLITNRHFKEKMQQQSKKDENAMGPFSSRQSDIRLQIHQQQLEIDHIVAEHVSIAANTASKEKTQPQRIEPSMAVEAGHLNLFPPQLITNRNLLNSNAGNAGTYNIQMGFGMPFTGTLQESLLPFPQSLVCDSVPVKTSVKAESGVTYNVPVAPRKRSRDSFNPISNFTVPQENNNNNNNLSELSSFLGRDIPLQIHQQQLEIDHIVAEHTNKIRVELEEKQKQHARLLVLVLAIGVGVMKKMKEKDEQIQRMGKLNWVLQERVKSLYVENQLWRDLVKIERQRANDAHLELEKERLAAATAAEDIMAMILKLQNEKSLIEMEANQYRRLTKEKQLHDQGVIHSLRWIVMKHELERGLLEDQF